MTEWLKQFTKQHRRLMQGLVSLVLLAVLIWRSNVSELIEYLGDAPLVYLVPWLIGYDLVMTFVWGNGVYSLFRRLKVGGYGRIIATGYKLQVLATVVPGRLGDLGLLYFLKDLYTLRQSTAVLLVDKLITLFVTFVLAAIGLGVMFSWHYSAAVAVTMFAGLGLFLLSLSQRSRGLRCWVRTRLLGRLADRFDDFYGEIVATATDSQGIATNLLLTLFRVTLAGVSLTLILSWFGVKVALWYVILVQAIAQLATMVPLTLMGIGVLEAVNVALLGRVGVMPEVILAASLSSRAIHLTFTLVVFLIWMRKTALIPQQGQLAKD
jgi:uncharacterized membrane protein YbhN (UPF0104 family)